jgi:hypothetical protein
MTTAVEWLIEKHFGSIENCSPNFRKHIEQANKIFEEQMIEFAKYTSVIDTDKSDMNKVINFYLTLDGEEFVEETFKSE